jgi:hypothetical protein
VDCRVINVIKFREIIITIMIPHRTLQGVRASQGFHVGPFYTMNATSSELSAATRMNR